MSRFSGRQFKGASRVAREARRTEADARNAATPLERRRRWVQGRPEDRLLLQLFGEQVAS